MLVKARAITSHGEAGFTLVELMTVTAIVAIIGGMAAAVSTNYLARSRADSAVAAAISTIEVARNQAIAERRNIELHFDAPNRIRLVRVEPDGSTTEIADVELENRLEFKQFTGVSDTPDEFGASDEIDFDGPDPVAFTSDGSLIDGAGDPSNGTILLGAGTDKLSARAITLFGMTGLIQSWRWTGTEWVR